MRANTDFVMVLVTLYVINNKLLLDEVYCDIQNNHGQNRGYQPKLKAADKPYRDLDYSGNC